MLFSYIICFKFIIECHTTATATRVYIGRFKKMEFIGLIPVKIVGKVNCTLKLMSSGGHEINRSWLKPSINE